MGVTIELAVSRFGATAKDKLANPGASGQPEDQLRAPFEHLLTDIAEISHFHSGTVTAVGEAAQGEPKTRPDYAVTVEDALVGFVELKAPGKGADPRKFKDPHDREQWKKLRSLPNLIYTDGNSFSLWQNGELVGSILNLDGDIETSGKKLNHRRDSWPCSRASCDGSRFRRRARRSWCARSRSSADYCVTRSQSNCPSKARRLLALRLIGASYFSGCY